MWDLEIGGITCYNLLNWFFIYSFFGWIWESSYVSWQEKRFVNRGYVTGPVVTIYGAGAILLCLVFHGLPRNPILLFFGGMVVTTVLEYLTSVVMEWIFHTSWWDYSEKKFNFQGRVCIESSICWGVFTVIMFFVLHPFVEWIVRQYSVERGKSLVMAVLMIYGIDFTISTVSAANLGQKMKHLEILLYEYGEIIQKSRIYTSMGEWIEKLEDYAGAFKRKNIQEKIEWYQKAMLEKIEYFGVLEYRNELKQKFQKISEQYEKIVEKGDLPSKRWMRSYPYLKEFGEIKKKIHLLKNKKERRYSKMERFTFRGGIHPYDGKDLSKDKPIRNVLPKGELAYLVSQHIGAPAVPIVEKGDHILMGQKIAEAGGFVSVPIHSSVSGTVKGIEPRLTTTGTMCNAIIVENDGLYESVKFEKRESLENLSPEQIIQIVKEAGIVGMGGAGFPTHVKLSPKEPDKIEYIIANCSECEPYLTSDYRRMLENPEMVVGGVRAILKIFPQAKGIIAVEDNKRDAAEALRRQIQPEDHIEVMELKTKYPQGAERQLIYATTGRAINSAMLPADAGCIVNNCDTVCSIYRAVYEGRPLMHRIVTVTGDAIANPQNFCICTGMNYHELIEEAGGFKKEPKKIVSGGPMMGFALYNLDVPATKTSSALLCMTKDEAAQYEPSACINCGKCVEVCPGRVIPARLADFAERHDEEMFLKYDGMECCECGCCSYICPAKRHLTQSIKSMRKIILGKRKKK